MFSGSGTQMAQPYDATMASGSPPEVTYQMHGRAAYYEEGLLKTGGRPGSFKRFLIIVLVIWLTAWAFFASFSALYMLAYKRIPVTLWIVAINTSLWCAFKTCHLHLAKPARVEKMVPQAARKNMYFNCLLGVILGSLVGEALYKKWMMDFDDFDLRRHYTNVGASESAAAHADASVLIFPEGTKPDATKFIGYDRGGSTYCVAPIVQEDASSSSTGEAEGASSAIQYWAVGKDCCSGNVYSCDGVKTSGARAGLVTRARKSSLDFLNGITFADDYENYSEATRMAMAKYDMAGAEKPLLVRFVKDISTTRRNMYFWAWNKWLVVSTMALGLMLFATIIVLSVAYDAVAADLMAAKKTFLNILAGRTNGLSKQVPPV